jgi:hypothetical protein
LSKASKSPAFKETVAAIKRLTGKAAEPLEGADDRIPGGYGWLMDEDRARAFVEQHRTEILDRGFYLFFTRDLTETNGCAVAILPVSDVYRVIAVVGTEGANSKVSNEDLITWLRELEKAQPFVITGVGLDFIEGRFTTALQDPGALVKRINKLCPDGDEGPAVEQHQVEQLQRTNKLYLWWD